MKEKEIYITKKGKVVTATFMVEGNTYQKCYDLTENQKKNELLHRVVIRSCQFRIRQKTGDTITDYKTYPVHETAL